MANFHTNYLVVAADEENMLKVLRRFAQNIHASGVDAEFSYYDLQGIESAQEMYFELHRYISEWYMWSFSSAPAGSEGMQQAGAPIELGNGMTVSIAMAPHGRGLSDSATVKMERCGFNWVFSMDYTTAWRSNSDDVDLFFTGLDPGEYGVAFYDADEYDGYESVDTKAGPHHGGTGLFGFLETVRMTVHDLRSARDEARYTERGDIDDLGELANLTALRGWPKYGWSGGYEDDGYYSTNDGEELNTWNRPSINWRKPKASDWREIDNAISLALGAFPYMTGRFGDYTPEGNDAAEALLPGGELIATADWITDYGTPCVWVSDANGARVGSLSGWAFDLFDDWRLRSSSPMVFACILPHLHVTLWWIKPKSQRAKSVYGPEFFVRFELESVNASALIDEVHELLEKDYADRAVSSIHEEAK